MLQINFGGVSLADFVFKNELMDKAAMERAITRMSFEIIERNKGIENIYLVGIQRRGVIIAKRIAKKIAEIESKHIEVGVLDITFYRDDLSMLNQHPKLSGTEIDFVVDGSKIILVDNVLYTGRTIRAAIDALMELGRPDSIQLAILIDRGHRELPIRADYVGKNIPTSKDEIIAVNVTEIDNTENVVIGVKINAGK
jgi:pyrimidine operon attenuation protein/uracil phosphoribosyltransferase